MLQGVHLDFHIAEKSKMCADILWLIFRRAVFLCELCKTQNGYIFAQLVDATSKESQYLSISVPFPGGEEGKFM